MWLWTEVSRIFFLYMYPFATGGSHIKLLVTPICKITYYLNLGFLIQWAPMRFICKINYHLILVFTPKSPKLAQLEK